MLESHWIHRLCCMAPLGLNFKDTPSYHKRPKTSWAGHHLPRRGGSRVTCFVKTFSSFRVECGWAPSHPPLFLGSMARYWHPGSTVDFHSFFLQLPNMVWDLFNFFWYHVLPPLFAYKCSDETVSLPLGFPVGHHHCPLWGWFHPCTNASFPGTRSSPSPPLFSALDLFEGESWTLS